MSRSLPELQPRDIGSIGNVVLTVGGRGLSPDLIQVLQTLFGDHLAAAHSDHFQQTGCVDERDRAHQMPQEPGPLAGR